MPTDRHTATGTCEIGHLTNNGFDAAAQALRPRFLWSAISWRSSDGARGPSCADRACLEHFPEKWTPVFRKEMRPSIESRARSCPRPRRILLNLFGTRARAFPGKVDTGFPQGNATKHGIQSAFLPST